MLCCDGVNCGVIALLWCVGVLILFMCCLGMSRTVVVERWCCCVDSVFCGWYFVVWR